MNKIILSGRIANDLIIRNTGQTEALLFSVAVQRNYKTNDGNYESDFINCKAFGNTATFIHNYFKKGDGIEIEGRLETSTYEKDGKKLHSTAVLVNAVEFAKGSKKEEKSETNEDAFRDFGNKVSEDQFDLPF